eukprot:TRINITY_DN3793_c0_g1_i1.p1 TRINITY_DN3793_c0_g1~~TRINITY_DN3793_c0_g1_i1.p1  ORF type:complete len:110 (+),score=17.08 TRINITY_DN3793_c0_g1_i1:103-432(+)
MASNTNTPSKDEQHIESPQEEEGFLRWAAYAQRITRPLAKVSRYAAYTSDVGEAFRPVVSPTIVNLSYGVAFGYCILDVAYNGYKANKKGENVTRAVAHATVFQGLASF